MSVERVHEMIADACLRTTSETEFTTDLRAFLESHRLDAEDIEAILAAPPRLAVYRRLVRNNLVEVVRRMMPRARARMNDAHERCFDASIDAFLDEAAPRTHYLRDVPIEFLAWAVPRWRARGDLPAWLPDLASHELVHFEVSAGPTPRDGAPKEPGEVALDRPLAFAEAKRLVHYQHAVHALPGEIGDRSEPEARAVSLLVYRDAAHHVRFLELTPLASAILSRLFAGEPLGRALAPACATVGAALDEAVLADTARLLADLGERGVLLGGGG
jgi:hypothetical protein